MRRNVLIAQCAAGEISEEQYRELCEQYPWLKANVETARRKNNMADTIRTTETDTDINALIPSGIEIKATRRYKRQGDR